MSLLLDTNILYAYGAKNDRGHDDARAIMRKVFQGRYGTPVITDLVIAELLTLVRYRARDRQAEEMTRRLLPLPDSEIPGLACFDVGSHSFPKVWDRFALHRDRRLSFVDASHLVLMEEHQIDMLATFDKGFDGLVHVVP